MKNSVLSGNPGQVAYISANAFMDSLASYRHNCGLPGTSLQLGAIEADGFNDDSIDDGISKSMVHTEAIPLLVKAISVPIALQVIACLDVYKISATPILAQDPIFSSLLSGKDAQPNRKVKMSSEEAKKVVVDMLRLAMELQTNEKLGMSYHSTVEPLGTEETRYQRTFNILRCRLDSICSIQRSSLERA